MAGLLLKNNIRLRLEGFPQEVILYVKQNIFLAIGDAVVMIRNTVSTVIDTLLVELGPATWPEALSQLIDLVDSQDQHAQEVSVCGARCL
jgi:transportin-1